MAEVKDKVITAESLKAVHDYGESNYIKGIQKNGTDLIIDTNRKANVLVPILDTSDNTASISSTSSSVNLGWLKNENSKKFAPKTFASQVIVSSRNVLSDKISSIDSTISDNYNTLNNKFSSYLPLSGGTVTGATTFSGGITGNVTGDLTGTASNASKLSNLSVGNKYGNIPRIGINDGIMHVGSALYFHDSDNADNTTYDAYIRCSGNNIQIGSLMATSGQFTSIFATNSGFENYKYTTFFGDIVSSGTVTVTIIFNCLCMIHGNLTLNGTVSTTTEILDNTQVPPNPSGIKYINVSNSQNSSYTRPLALKTSTDGGLALHYGASGRYDFSWIYPVEPYSLGGG